MLTSRPRYGIVSAMFWHMMLLLFSPLYLMFGLVFRSQQARLALHHQVLVLQRQLGKRPSLLQGERLALVLSSLLLGKEKLTEALLIVKPETLVGWHRAIVRRHWRFLSRRKPGRPPAISPEMELTLPPKTSPGHVLVFEAWTEKRSKGDEWEAAQTGADHQ
jgi:hypothetical protein